MTASNLNILCFEKELMAASETTAISNPKRDAQSKSPKEIQQKFKRV